MMVTGQKAHIVVRTKSTMAIVGGLVNSAMVVHILKNEWTKRTK